MSDIYIFIYIHIYIHTERGERDRERERDLKHINLLKSKFMAQSGLPS